MVMQGNRECPLCRLVLKRGWEKDGGGSRRLTVFRWVWVVKQDDHETWAWAAKDLLYLVHELDDGLSAFAQERGR